MSTSADQAVTTFAQGFNCAQSILAAYGEPLGMPRETALRVAAAFGGGIGGLGDTCGAVTGALMVLGLALAKIDPQDSTAKQKNYQLTRQFIDEFKKRNRCTLCRELLGCDISTAQGMQQAKEAGRFTTICPGLVKDAAEIVEQLLAEGLPVSSER